MERAAALSHLTGAEPRLRQKPRDNAPLAPAPTSPRARAHPTPPQLLTIQLTDYTHHNRVLPLNISLKDYHKNTTTASML